MSWFKIRALEENEYGILALYDRLGRENRNEHGM